MAAATRCKELIVLEAQDSRHQEMAVLAALIGRVSPLRVVEPGPTNTDLDQILAAGVRAPDHGRLRPWRFLLIRGAARDRFGDVLAESLKRRKQDLSESTLQAEHDKALRAPLIIVVAAAVRGNTKVPALEQIVSAGAAAQNMLVAAHALGYGGFWRTGDAAYDDHVKQSLRLRAEDEIVGFLYLGHIETPGRAKTPDPVGVVEEWTGLPAGPA
ncbi:MAG TPA: nitroreductase [Steroidobacteraceae bacterium]|jgi:nitroreductase|nr:nitroreductase [Steroidobacteraceae bacterium]